MSDEIKKSRFYSYVVYPEIHNPTYTTVMEMPDGGTIEINIVQITQCSNEKTDRSELGVYRFASEAIFYRIREIECDFETLRD